MPVHRKTNDQQVLELIAKNNTQIDVAHHNQNIDVAHHNHTHIEVAHHNHIDFNHNDFNTHIEVAPHNQNNIYIVVAHPDVRIHLTVRRIANANLLDQVLPLSQYLALDQDQAHAHHSIAHLDPPPDPHLEEDPQHEVILLFIDY